MGRIERVWRRSPLRRSPMILDTVLALFMTALTLVGSVGEAYPAHQETGVPVQLVPHPPVAAYLLVAAASLVLAWRRRRPMATLCASTAAVLVYTGLGYVDGAALLAPMVALYTVTVTGTARRALLAAAATLVVLMSVDAAFEPFGALGGSVVVLPVEVAAATFLGLAVANRRAYVAAVEDRAVRAEQSREEEARRRVDAERMRIARELHDVVAHNISMINVQARAAARVIPDPPEAGAEALAAIKEASAEALRELRTILGLLRQPGESEPTAPAPGVGQLGTLVSATSRAGLPTSLTVAGEPYRLPPAVSLAAYRIVQESLTNALRYAGPATAEVSIAYRTGQIVIDVSDDGRGASAATVPATAAPAAAPGAGLGISGMRERAQAIGGSLRAGPRPEGGFAVHAILPGFVGGGAS